MKPVSKIKNKNKIPLNVNVLYLQSNKPIRGIFAWPADHQFLSEKGSCTADSMDSSTNGSDGCSLKSKSEKIDFCKNVHMSCLLNLKWSLQICSGRRQPKSSHRLLAWMLHTYSDGVLRDISETMCFFLQAAQGLNKIVCCTNNGSNMSRLLTPVRFHAKCTSQTACLQDKVLDATLCRGWLSRVKMSMNGSILLRVGEPDMSWEKLWSCFLFSSPPPQLCLLLS